MLNEGVSCDLIKCKAKIPLFICMPVDTALIRKIVIKVAAVAKNITENTGR